MFFQTAYRHKRSFAYYAIVGGHLATDKRSMTVHLVLDQTGLEDKRAKAHDAPVGLHVFVDETHMLLQVFFAAVRHSAHLTTHYSQFVMFGEQVVFKAVGMGGFEIAKRTRNPFVGIVFGKVYPQKKSVGIDQITVGTSFFVGDGMGGVKLHRLPLYFAESTQIIYLAGILFG